MNSKIKRRNEIILSLIKKNDFQINKNLKNVSVKKVPLSQKKSLKSSAICLQNFVNIFNFKAFILKNMITDNT